MTDEGPSRPHREDEAARPVPADWLALRREADEAAREGTQRLVTRLWRDLRRQGDDTTDHTVHLIDLGAGTGANQAWLAPRLPFPARWTLLDHDADLLDRATSAPSRRVHGGLEEVPRLLEESDAWADVLTCSALLDLLTEPELDDLADLLTRTRTPALFSLSVDGGVRLVPEHEDDAVIGAAFDAHQRRGGRAGATAAGYLADSLRSRGAEVVVATTPWRLTAAHAPLVVRYLTDRVEAAVEQEPGIAERAHAWLDARTTAALDGGLAVVVGHVDLLVLPG